MEDSIRAATTWLLRPEHLILSGIIAGVVEAALRAGFPRNLSALLAISMGLLGGILYVLFYNGHGDPFSPPVGRMLAEGLAMGLMGSGVWGGVRDLTRVFTGAETPHGTPLQERRGPGPPPVLPPRKETP